MKNISTTLLCIFTSVVIGNAQQINIDKIDLMPNIPNPMEIQDWKSVTSAYDSLVFSSLNQGTYLPLVSNWESGIVITNEPTFGLPSYVGSEMPTRGEAINMIPALISASLIGIDKTNQFGKNWVEMIRDFFNPDQGVYVNNPGGKTGSDWWYDTMCNIFFYQLKSLYPETLEFNTQFRSIADSWLEAVVAMGGSATPWQVPYMNYRAWNLETMEPLDEGVIEPEAAGAIGWILYNAFVETGEDKYRIGAEWCIEFLNSLDENPSYELQLPYGIYTAARMNAELNTNYDIEKMVNWSFDIGPLREWGCIIGTWNGNDVSGLIGEAEASYPDYAFFMNGAEQFGALVPMVRYDDRFARAIGKWALNLTNASRLFYSAYHDAEHQDNKDWISQYDTKGGMAYEALKESKNGIEGYATGDAMGGGWAETNLCLYGSSHAGIFGGIISEVHNSNILQLDLLKTDYYGAEAYPSFLFFNPLNTSSNIQMTLPTGTWNIYDATQNTVLNTTVSNSTTITLTTDEGTIIVLVPSDKPIEHIGQKSLAGGIVIDYNNGQVQDSKLPRLKTIAAEDTLVEFGSLTKIYCTVDQEIEQTLQYQWLIDGIVITTETKDSMVFLAGNIEKQSIIKCIVSETNGWTDSASLKITTINAVPIAPKINSIEAEPRKIEPSASSTFTTYATDLNNDSLSYLWFNISGDIIGNTPSIIWNAPLEEGIYSFSCKVTDTDLLYDIASIDILVRREQEQAVLVADYPLNGNARDISINKNHGIAQYVEYYGEPDAFLGKSAFLNNGQSLIRIPNNTEQQGNTALAIAFAFKIDNIPSNEAFIISHGSWQERWKFSISDGKLRFTMKTTSKTVDIDSDLLETNKWYEVVGQYSGTELELYMNKKLVVFNTLVGEISNTPKDISVGQMLPNDFNYPFSGYIDNLLIFTGTLTNQEIDTIHEIYDSIRLIANSEQIICYPNPANDQINLIFPKHSVTKANISIYSISGQCIYKELIAILDESTNYSINISQLKSGVYFLKTNINNESYAAKIIKIHAP
ncbi:MAG: T9SS type A sorting domain-containing protein [Salinivirgaceae bacterium]|nr:T9SS type A sorting domain-containing protein [Salinivirgaceae bacterium]